MSPTADPATVPGLPESTLAPADLAALPATAAAAPWECRARALVWVQRATAPEHDWSGHPLPVSTVAFVEYLESPVGTYHEVLAAAALRRGSGPPGARVAGQIPFIAVDSLPSVLGGRANWALPKTMARFEGDLGQARVSASTPTWSVSVRPRSAPSGPRFPLRLRFWSAGPLGPYRTALRARGRLVRVLTEVEGPVIGPWLGGGSRTAVLCEGTMRIGAPVGRPR